MIITLANAKGGVGKTTSAIYLATVAKHSDPSLQVTLIDADPQQSASDWDKTAKENRSTLEFDVENMSREKDVARILELVNLRSSLYVIDTQPGDTALTRASIHVADLVVIPCEAEPMSVRRAWKMFDLCQGKGAFLITKARPRTNLFKVVMNQLVSGHAEFFTSTIKDSMEYAKAFGCRPRNTSEYSSVWIEIKEAMGWR